MKAWMVAVVGAAMLWLVGGWYIGSPWITLYGFKSAVENRDVEAVIGYVDFDALRRNLKGQVHAGAEKRAPRTDALGWSIPDKAPQFAMIDQQIDAYVTPDTARSLFASANAGSSGSVNSIGNIGDMARDIAIDRQGLGTFVVRGKSAREGIGFVFTAHGLGWKLSGLRLPASMAQAIGKRPIAW